MTVLLKHFVNVVCFIRVFEQVPVKHWRANTGYKESAIMGFIYQKQIHISLVKGKGELCPLLQLTLSYFRSVTTPAFNVVNIR